MKILPRTILVGLAAGVGAVAALRAGRARQQRALGAQIDRLVHLGTVSARPAVRPHPDEMEQLPAPVARYLRWALPTHLQLQQVRLRQVGTLRTATTSARWMPFEAEHTVVPPATGFVWSARVTVAPWLRLQVRDAFIGGRGSAEVSLLAAWPVTTAGGTPEMNAGSLHRYLAEAVWYPTALLPGAGVQWAGIDAASALATLSVEDVTVSLEFRFAPTGEVAGIYTPARWGTFPEGYRQAPWEGRFYGYRAWNGMSVPTRGEVAWYVDNQWQPVWKGQITGCAVTCRTS